MSERQLVQGNEACARGALAAGCSFFAGYPISPSSEIAELLVRELPARAGVFIQMEDEIASMGAVIGASLGGRRAMTATSGPGFTLMQEHLGYASLAEIPCVVIDVMRGGPSTGLPTSPAQGDVMQARWGSHGDRATVALAPGNVQEVYSMTIDAFRLAETLRTPVVVLYDEVIGHMREGVELHVPTREQLGTRTGPREPFSPSFLPYAANEFGVAMVPDFGCDYRFHVTGLMHDERGYPMSDHLKVAALLERLEYKVDAALDVVPSESYRLDDASIVLVAYGIVARTARTAVDSLRDAGLRAGLLRPRLLWPLPVRSIEEAIAGAQLVVVTEMNRGQLASEVERLAGRQVALSPYLKAGGSVITAEELVEHVLAATREGVFI
ncbi:MAG: 2-oxoacid:acceptor oxidoreductase subunit alpha [Acidimicrobiales bacterium]